MSVREHWINVRVNPEELARIRRKAERIRHPQYRCLYEKNGDGRILRES